MSRRSTSPHDAEYYEFVAASWRRLCWTAYMLTGDRQLAEDLAQTAPVKTYVAWPRVRRDDAFAYARRVLVNANIDRLRRRHLTEERAWPSRRRPVRTARWRTGTTWCGCWPG